MPDPVTITLGGLALLTPFYKAGKELYNGWCIAQAFPADMEKLATQLLVQYTIFRCTAEFRVCDCVIQIDETKPKEGDTMVLLRHLRMVLNLFRVCDVIIEKYKPPGARNRLRKTQPTATSDPKLASSPRSSHTDASRNTTPSRDTASYIAAEVQHPVKRQSWLKRNFSKSNKPKNQPVQATERAGAPPARVLQVPGLEEEEQKADQRLKANATISGWKRVPWIAGDKRQLEETIAEIKRSNKDLSDFLQIKQPQSSHLLCPEAPLGIQNSKNKNMLSFMHTALQEINTVNKPEGPFLLGIEVREEQEVTGQEVAQRLHSRTVIPWACLVQRHKSLAMDDIPLTLAMVAKSGSTPRTHPRISCLANTEGSQQENHGMSYWGYFDDARNNTFEVHHDKEARWSSITTLDAIIRHPSYRRHITSYQVLQVARLLSIAYSSFFNIRTVCRDPRLEDVRFYRTNPESFPVQTNPEAHDWDDDPLILRPWLFFGFGEEPARRTQLGTGSAMARPRNASMIELGLILCQLATGNVLTFPRRSTGYIDAKRKALQELTIVERFFGPGLTVLITECLNYPIPNQLFSSKRADEAEQDALHSLTSQLFMIEQSFIEDLSPAFRLADETDEEELYESSLRGGEDLHQASIEDLRQPASSNVTQSEAASSTQGNKATSMMMERVFPSNSGTSRSGVTTTTSITELDSVATVPTTEPSIRHSEEVDKHPDIEYKFDAGAMTVTNTPATPE